MSNEMKRCCNGCLNIKPIVDEENGYCQYCYDNRRDKSTKEILQGLNALEKFIKLTKDKTK